MRGEGGEGGEGGRGGRGGEGGEERFEWPIGALIFFPSQAAERCQYKLSCTASGIVMPGYCFNGGAATCERRSREGKSQLDLNCTRPHSSRGSAPLLAGLPHTAFTINRITLTIKALLSL